MKVLLRAISWILCIMLVILPILAEPKPPPPPLKAVNYPKKTWKLDKKVPTSYKTLITSLRPELDSLKVCGIPSTAKSPPTSKAFILVEITSLTNKKVTLAFRASNVYYVGYMDELKGVTRANFVKEDFNELKDSDLFKAANIKSELPHGGGYDDLERVAKKTRENLKLGVNSLSLLLDTINGADYTAKDKPKDIGQDLAKFALTVIQMIAEGTRYKYIEKKVNDLGTKQEASFSPDAVFLRLENSWGKISNRLHAFSTTTKDCDKVKLQVLPEFPEFADIKTEVGLIQFKQAVVAAAMDQSTIQLAYTLSSFMYDK